MKVLKDFKTVSQVFKVGDEFYDDIENLEHWTARGFVEAEKFVDGVVQPSTPATPVPTATFA
jgi:hypothetical protein